MRTFMILLRRTAASETERDALVARLDDISEACAEAFAEGEMLGLIVRSETEPEDIMRTARQVADPRKGGWVWVMEIGATGAAAGNPRGWNRWKRLAAG